MYAGNLNSSPPYGSSVDGRQSLALGLVAFWPLNDEGGRPFDIIGNLGLPLGSGAFWTSAALDGLSCTNTTANAQGAASQSLQLTGALSIAMGFRQIGNPGGPPMMGGLTYDSSLTSPFFGYAFEHQTSGNVNVAFALNLGGTLKTITGATAASGADSVMAASHTGVAQSLFQNGALVGSGSNSGTITYGAAPLMVLGNPSIFPGRNPNLIIYWFAIWNRPLSASEHFFLGTDVSAIFQLLSGPPFPFARLTVAFPRSPLVVTRPRQLGRTQKSIQAKSPGGNPRIAPRSIPPRTIRPSARFIQILSAHTRFVPPIVNSVSPRFFPIPFRRQLRSTPPLFFRQSIPGSTPPVPPIALNLDPWRVAILSSDSDPLAIDPSSVVIVSSDSDPLAVDPYGVNLVD